MASQKACQFRSSHIKSMSNIMANSSIYFEEAALNSQKDNNCLCLSGPDVNSFPSKMQETSRQCSVYSDDFPLVDSELILLTEAKKKHLYRTRIKEGNPSLWSSIKRREASRKKQLRERRRCIIADMQRAMELGKITDSPDSDRQRIYLETLKERYPKLWDNLTNAIPATEHHNERLFLECNNINKRIFPKPVKEYKDVIEAQKKRLYRQRMKEERPEMYKKLKSRECHARRLQRQKQRAEKLLKEAEQNIDRTHAEADLHNITPSMPSERDNVVLYFKTEVDDDQAELHTSTDGRGSKPNDVCDRKQLNYQTHKSDSCLESNSKETNKMVSISSEAGLTQSHIFCYWNDFTNICTGNSQKTTTSITFRHLPNT